MTKPVFAAVLLCALGGLVAVALWPADPGALPPGTEPGAGASATGTRGPAPALPEAGTGSTGGSTGTPTPRDTGSSAATPAGSEGESGELTLQQVSAKGTREALDAQLAKARSGATAADRDAAAWQAWVEYVSWAQRENGGEVRAAAMRDLIGIYRGETDAEVRRKLLDRIDKTAESTVVDLVLETARSGQTEEERLGAIQDLGRYGEPGAVTAMMRLHPDAPNEATAHREMQSIRARARARLLELLRGSPSEAERAMIERSLITLPAGDKR